MSRLQGFGSALPGDHDGFGPGPRNRYLARRIPKFEETRNCHTSFSVTHILLPPLLLHPSQDIG